jgi:hypothetical protein
MAFRMLKEGANQPLEVVMAHHFSKVLLEKNEVELSRGESSPPFAFHYSREQTQKAQ